jgi:hypothetical protein
MDYGEFAKLPDRVKIEARLSWLEWKMLDMLWLLISLTSLLVGAIAAWLTGETIGNRSLWLLIPVFVSPRSWLDGCLSEEPSRGLRRVSN